MELYFIRPGNPRVLTKFKISDKRFLSPHQLLKFKNVQTKFLQPTPTFLLPCPLIPIFLSPSIIGKSNDVMKLCEVVQMVGI